MERTILIEMRQKDIQEIQKKVQFSVVTKYIP